MNSYPKPVFAHHPSQAPDDAVGHKYMRLVVGNYYANDMETAPNMTPVRQYHENVSIATTIT